MFPNDDPFKFEVSPETLQRPLAQKSWIHTSCGHSPRDAPPQEIPIIGAMLLISHAPSIRPSEEAGHINV
jgi:hypothetical protein